MNLNELSAFGQTWIARQVGEIGKASYSLYLLHPVAIGAVLLLRANIKLEAWLLPLLRFAFPLALAALAWKRIEQLSLAASAVLRRMRSA